MAAPSNSTVQNLVPIQGLFDTSGNFQTFIGQGQPFYAIPNPYQSGLIITNSTIDSTTIGATTPSTGVFSAAQVNSAPVGVYDVTNKQYVDSAILGISWKPPVNYGTTNNVTLSGLGTQSGGDWPSALTSGMRVLVKNQSNQPDNGIYVVASGAWVRSQDANTWTELVSALVFVESGNTLGGSAWYCPVQPGGTLGTTNVTWSNFSVAATYTAGTGLTLSSYQFSITSTAVSAGSYGSASSVPTYTVNAQGQLTAASNTSILIANTQVTGLGTMSTQNASSVAITGGTITGLSAAIPVASGGTGATTLTGYVKGSGTTALTGATTIPNTDITGLGTMSTQNANNVSITGGSITGLSSPLPVASGGSGASTLSGYLFGNGTGAFTASSTIPSTAISGLGTMATQNASSVAITGGTINGASIGATTRASGDFTTLSANTVTSTTPVLSFNASNSIATFGSTTSSSYNQLVIQNKSTSAGASANYVISNDQGTDSSYYGEFGMNSSTFSASTPNDFFSINNGVYFSGHDGDITFGSGNGYKSYFAWGTTGQSAHVINAVGALGFTTNLGTTPALSGTTGYGTSGQTLITAGSTGAPSWGTLGITGGGTNGTATPTAGAIAYGTGSAYAFTAAGTTGQVLTSNGSSAPTWATPVAYATVTDDTSTNATRYLLFANQTTGNLTTEYTSSTKLQFNPSTGALTSGKLIILP